MKVQRYAFLWLLVAFFAACTNEVELPDEAKEVLARSEYAQRFDKLWKVLDKNYVLFDYMDVDFDQLRTEYILRMDSVATDSAFVAIVRDFCSTFHEKDISFSIDRAWYETNVITENNQAYWAGETGYLPGYGASGNKNKYIGPLGMNTVQRYGEESGTRSYALFLACEYKTTELPEDFDRQINEILETPVRGIVLDMRSAMTCSAVWEFLSYFYAKGETCSYKYRSRSSIRKNRSDYTAWGSESIQGYGMLADYPVAIIVDSLTCGQYAWMAHMLAERENVALVGTTELNGATWGRRTTYCNEDQLIYPYFQIKTKSQNLEDPMALDIVVDWNGECNEHGYYEDKCLVAALDYIDSYNNKRP